MEETEETPLMTSWKHVFFGIVLEVTIYIIPNLIQLSLRQIRVGLILTTRSYHEFGVRCGLYLK
jgi:hypothetical protein